MDESDHRVAYEHERGYRQSRGTRRETPAAVSAAQERRGAVVSTSRHVTVSVHRVMRVWRHMCDAPRSIISAAYAGCGHARELTIVTQVI